MSIGIINLITVSVMVGLKKIARIHIATEKLKSMRRGKTFPNIASARAGMSLLAQTMIVKIPLSITPNGKIGALCVMIARRKAKIRLQKLV